MNGLESSQFTWTSSDDAVDPRVFEAMSTYFTRVFGKRSKAAII